MRKEDVQSTSNPEVIRPADTTMEESKHESDCCRAEVKTIGDSFNEGTMHWECEKCGKPCNDLYYIDARPAHTTENQGKTEVSDVHLRQDEMSGEPQEDWENLVALQSLLEVNKWAAQGRTADQVYGVTNFLTGLGGKSILALLSKRDEEVLTRFKDHYWDSLTPHKDMILHHIGATLTKSKGGIE